MARTTKSVTCSQASMAAVGRGRRNQLAAQRDRPASIEVVHDQGLIKHIAKPGHSRQVGFSGALSSSNDWNLGSQIQLPLPREPDGVFVFDWFSCSFLDARTGSLDI